MSKIIIEIPDNKNEVYKVNDPHLIQSILKLLEDRPTKVEAQQAFKSLIGSWKNKFNPNVPTATVSEKIRDKAWRNETPNNA